MSNTRSFGRRAVAQPPRPAKAPAEAAAPRIEAAPVEQSPAFVESPLPAAIDMPPSVDDELREWKQTRQTQIPWRQLSLMASLSFGIGSFVLTGEIAAAVNWLLYGLSAVSLYFWWMGKMKK
jgi:hypothetical protein